MVPSSVDVKESKAIDEKIRLICVNYWQLMIDCANDESKREDFMENPRPFLNKVGMTIPDGVKILLDNVNPGWPTIYIKTTDEKIMVGEGKLGVHIIDELKSGQKIDERMKLTEQAEVDVNVNEELKNCDVVVKLPFMDAKVDLLGEFKFSDDSEIILSSCC